MLTLRVVPGVSVKLVTAGVKSVWLDAIALMIRSSLPTFDTARISLWLCPTVTFPK